MKGAFFDHVTRLVLLPFFVPCATWASAQPAADTSTTYVFRLKHVRDGFSLSTYDVTIRSTQTLPAREPDFGGRRIRRGILHWGADRGTDVRLSWDEEAGKLYADLNRNGDLTDDPVFENGTREKAADRPQEFKGVTISSPRGAQQGLWNVNLTLHGVGSAGVFGNVVVRSGWEDAIELQGRKLMLSVTSERADTITWPAGVFLRPAGKPLRKLYEIERWQDGVFYEGRFYDLSFQFDPAGDGGTMVARLAERKAPLAECQLTGEGITRLVLTGTGAQDPAPLRKLSWRARRALPHVVEFAAVFDEPRGKILLPPGYYEFQRLYLDTGTSAGVLSGYRKDILQVSTTAPAVLRVGAPLKNVVLAQWSSRDKGLSLEHRVTGAAGELYRLADNTPECAPTFAIYKKNKQLASGAFKFG